MQDIAFLVFEIKGEKKHDGIKISTSIKLNYQSICASVRCAHSHTVRVCPQCTERVCKAVLLSVVCVHVVKYQVCGVRKLDTHNYWGILIVCNDLYCFQH